MTDLYKLEALAKAAGGVAWHAGHLCRDDHPCDCAYIFDDGHAGAVASVHVDNGLPIADGGNDAPETELAKAIQRFIAAANPATILDLIASARRDAEEIERLKSDVCAFAAPWAVTYARDMGLPEGHLHPSHYDLLERCGARMVDFTRAAHTGEG